MGLVFREGDGRSRPKEACRRQIVVFPAKAEKISDCVQKIIAKLFSTDIMVLIVERW